MSGDLPGAGIGFGDSDAQGFGRIIWNITPGPVPPVASVEILTEHHENIPLLVEDDEVEVLPYKLLDWPLVPVFWDLLAGLMFLESKGERSRYLQEEVGSGVAPSWEPWQVLPVLTGASRKSLEGSEGPWAWW